MVKAVRRNYTLFRRLLWWSSIIIVQFFMMPTAYAASAGAIAQTYNTKSSNISQGALLSLASTGSATVELANSTSNDSRLVGVAANKPLLQLSGSVNSTNSTVQVVVSGSTVALISNINGSINAGDKLTASPVSGIGMKATAAAQIIGVAQANLSSVHTVTETVTEKSGKTITIKVGLLPVAVNVAYYSASSSSGTAASFVPPFIQSLANAVVGKSVPALRVLFGMLALVLGFVMAGIMFYTATRNSITSIGRNPLAQRAIHRGFIDIILAAIGVLLITFVVIYVILQV